MRLKVEEQTFDPMRIKVFIDGDLYPEWVQAIGDAGVWTIKGWGNPLSVEFEQLDSEFPIAILNLKEPITMDTDLEFGPVVLEDGLTAHDVEAIIVDGVDHSGQSLLGPCYCSMDVQGAAHHDYKQTDDFAWCLEVSDIESWCPVPQSSSGCMTVTPICNLDPLDIANWGQSEDTCTIGTPLYLGWGLYNLHFGYNTRIFPGDAMWELEASWDFSQTLCDPTPPPITVSDNFTAVDITNPIFNQPPRLVYGPEAADWIEGIYDPNDSNWHQVSPNPTPEMLRADPCGIYLLIDVEDEGTPGSFFLGPNPVCFDLLINGSIVNYPYGAVFLGSYMWYDNPPEGGSFPPDPGPPPPGEEYDDWPDPNWPHPSPGTYKIWEDGYVYGERYVDVIGMGGIFAIQGLEEVKARVTDKKGNWTRTGNLLEGIERQGQSENCDPITGVDYTIIDLFFFENHKYEDDLCYDWDGQPDHRTKCDGYVEIGSDFSVDLIAVTIQKPYEDPLPCIPVTLCAPYDQPEQSCVEVELYLLTDESEDWDHILNEVCCNIDLSSCDGDCFNIYGRYAVDRVFECGDIESGQPYPIFISDQSTSSNFGHPAFYDEHPVLYVSNDDSLIANAQIPGQLNMDYKDYAKAIGSGTGNDDDPQLISSRANIDACYYGDESRGEFVPRYTVSFTQCTPGYETQDNFKANVFSFGQEWLVAFGINGPAAYFPIQSQADIIFVLSHGSVASNNKSYMCWFFDNPLTSPPSVLPNLFQDPQWDAVITAQEWKENLPLTGDARWIAATTCYLLYGDSSGGSWEAWQDVVQEKCLESIMGFRDLHQSSGSAGESPEQEFWSLFCAYLNEDIPLPGYGNPVTIDNSCTELPTEDRWTCSQSEYNLVEFGVKCYMEAAYQQYNTCFPGWERNIGADQISPAAAVDEGAYYMLDNPNLAEGKRYPIYIVRQSHE